MYQRLGRSTVSRQEAYRGLFKAHMDDDVLGEIRGATNGNYILGTEHFQEEIGQMLGRRVVKGKAGVTDMRLNGTPVADTSVYRITMNDFLAGGGDCFTAFTRRNSDLGGEVDVDALETYLRANSPVREPYRDELIGVVVESTFNWYWLVDGLQQAGYRVDLANTVAMKQYDGLKYSGDEYDARHLAHMLRLGILRTGYVYPKEMRAVRDLARKRIQLVRTRTMHILAVENLVARQTGARISGNMVKQLTVEAVDEWGWLPDVALAAQANVMVLDRLEDVIKQIERRLCERVRLRPEYAVLKTTPGIGNVLATTIMLETGTIERFAQVGNFASYARCVDSA
ncbi:MAG: transposase, partial [Burkholderiales bacterium]